MKLWSNRQLAPTYREVKSNLFPYPLVACNTDEIDDEIYTWTDADHPTWLLRPHQGC
jgi:hypothetical protein